jgi:hypothetical protein
MEMDKGRSRLKTLVFGLYLELLTLTSVCTQGFSAGHAQISVFLRSLWLYLVHMDSCGACASS